jgi:hypothetical protein
MFYQRIFLKLFSAKPGKNPEKALCGHNQNTSGHLLHTVYGTVFENFRVFAKNF